MNSFNKLRILIIVENFKGYIYDVNMNNIRK